MTIRTTPDTVRELASGHVVAHALHVIADVGVAEELDGEPKSAEELAARLTLNADALSRLLRLVESHGLFARDRIGRWQHTEGSRLLRSDHPQSLRAYVKMSGTPFHWGSVTHLGHALRTGEAGICQLHPEGWCAYLDAHPEESATFQEAMKAKAHADVAAFLDTVDLSRFRRVADVGGGAGHLIKAVLARHAAMTGVLFELPAVAAAATPSERLEVVAGDFFVDPLPACDAYVLMNIVHDWDEKDAATILAAVAEAGRSSEATVFVVEAVMPDHPGPHWAKTLDVIMLAITGGRERTLCEYDALMASAGLELVRVTPTQTSFSIIEARFR